MALATAGDLIKAAMRKSGVLRSGGTPTNQQNQDFLDLLNLMLRKWSKRPGLQAVQYTRQFTWDAVAASKTLGPTGADFTNARPLKFLEGCSFKDTGAGVTYPVDIITKVDFDMKQVPSTQGYPFQLFCQFGLTNWTLFPYFVPSTALQLNLSTLEALAEYTSIANPIAFPIEYHAALLYNLVLEISDDVGRQPSRNVILMAQEELDSITSLHSTPPPLADVAPMLRAASRRFNIMDGGFSS